MCSRAFVAGSVLKITGLFLHLLEAILVIGTNV